MFLQLFKRWATDDNGKKLDSHISDDDYLKYNKI